MQYLESDGSNFETYSVTDRKPVEISKNRRNMAKASFLGNDPSKCVLDKLQASQIRKELIEHWHPNLWIIIIIIIIIIEHWHWCHHE